MLGALHRRRRIGRRLGFQPDRTDRTAWKAILPCCPATHLGIAVALLLFGGIACATAQPPNARIGEAVPRDVRELYDKGLQYLVKTQSATGEWTGGQQGPGITGLGLMVFLASGEDPNFGMYSNNVRRAVRSIISQQDASTGYF